MNWTQFHKKPVQVLLFALLLLSILGPWTYSSDGAPPLESCDKPYLVLDNGRCGQLMTGASVLTLVISNFFSMLIGAITGTVAIVARWREFFGSGLIMMLALPVVSGIIEIRKEAGQPHGNLHRIAWVIGAALSLVAALLLRSFQYWGMWLYLILAWYNVSRVAVEAFRKRQAGGAPA